VKDAAGASLAVRSEALQELIPRMHLYFVFISECLTTTTLV
jgi:hypothetical protein